MKNLTIAKLAAAADVNVETVRFYQRKGLLSQPQRPPGGIRRYGPDDVARLVEIKAAKRVGFSLDQIGELMRVRSDPSCDRAREIASARLAETRSRIAELETVAEALAIVLNECAESRKRGGCDLMTAWRLRAQHGARR